MTGVIERIIIGIFVTSLCVGCGSVSAQEDQGGGEKTKKTVAMSQPVFEGLQEAQQLIEAKQYSNGHQVLAKLLVPVRVRKVEWCVAAHVLGACEWV